jgi:hypothetical protein
MHEMKCRSTKQPATAAQRAKTRRCFHRARKGGEREREREREREKSEQLLSLSVLEFILNDMASVLKLATLFIIFYLK